MLEGKQTAVARLGSGVPYVTNDAQTKQIPKFGRKEDPFVQVIRAKVHLLTNQSRLFWLRVVGTVASGPTPKLMHHRKASSDPFARIKSAMRKKEQLKKVLAL